ncbi:MAG: sigma-70 family RNA polymerase sigma factor [Vicinamibacteria bacterium]|nr:sigma-70 family RNA polymerase sigma factor [Vicinamibacteria bacterium]
MEPAGIDVEKLYERYGPMVLRRCRQLLRDEDEAMDTAQDVFVQLLRRRQRLTDQYPSSLLYRIATNLCLNRIRDRRRYPDLPGDALLDRIARRDDLDDFDAPILLDRLFGRHPESTRVMAVLHYLDGMTLEQVACECGMSVSGVRKRLRGLRATLQAMEES